jgi:Flp pilus assembly protein TadG
MKRVIALLRSDDGASMLELSLMAPILVLLAIGLIEISRFAYYSIQVGGAARAGVQYGAQNLVSATDTSGMVAAATADAENVPGFAATASVSCTCADASPCNPTDVPADCASSHRIVYVSLDATGSMQSLLQLPLVPTSYSIDRTVTMRVEQ